MTKPMTAKQRIASKYNWELRQLKGVSAILNRIVAKYGEPSDLDRLDELEGSLALAIVKQRTKHIACVQEPVLGDEEESS